MAVGFSIREINSTLVSFLIRPSCLWLYSHSVVIHEVTIDTCVVFRLVTSDLRSLLVAFLICLSKHIKHSVVACYVEIILG